MKLDTKTRRFIIRALLDAYRQQSQLRIMLMVTLGENLDAIAGGENLSQVTANLIEWAERNDRVGDLLLGARMDTPGNILLRDAVSAFEVERYFSKKRYQRSRMGECCTSPILFTVFAPDTGSATASLHLS